jgi:hypothetical protein
MPLGMLCITVCSKCFPTLFVLKEILYDLALRQQRNRKSVTNSLNFINYTACIIRA